MAEGVVDREEEGEEEKEEAEEDEEVSELEGRAGREGAAAEESASSVNGCDITTDSAGGTGVNELERPRVDRGGEFIGLSDRGDAGMDLGGVLAGETGADWDVMPAGRLDSIIPKAMLILEKA